MLVLRCVQRGRGVVILLASIALTVTVGPVVYAWVVFVFASVVRPGLF